MGKAYVSAALRRLVYERANGCCEYCLVPELVTLVRHEVDHIIAEKHGGKTSEGNLAMACSLCNKLKGIDLASIDPTTGEIVRLYHPHRDRWSDHFSLQECRIEPLTEIGRVTVRLLQLNRKERIAERQLLVDAGQLKIPNP